MDEKPRIIFFFEKGQSKNKLPSNIEERLSGRIGMDDIHEITYLIQNNDKEKQKLYNFAFDKDDAIATNALWIMTHFSLHENEWLYQKQDEIIDRLLSVTNSSQQRLFLNLLYRQPLTNPPRVDFLNFCLDKMSSIQEPPATSVMCMKLAYELCRPIPELLREYTVILETMEAEFLSHWAKITRKKIQKTIPSGKSLQSY